MVIAWFLKDTFVRFCYLLLSFCSYFFVLYEYKDYILLIFLSKYNSEGERILSIFDYNDLVNSTFFLLSPILFILFVIHFFLFIIHFGITCCYKREFRVLILGCLLCTIAVCGCLFITLEYGSILYDYLNMLFFPEEINCFQFSLDVSLVAYSKFLFSFFFLMIFIIACLYSLILIRERLNYYYARTFILFISLVFILMILPPDLFLHFSFVVFVYSLLEFLFIIFVFFSEDIGYFGG